MRLEDVLLKLRTGHSIARISWDGYIKEMWNGRYGYKMINFYGGDGILKQENAFLVGDDIFADDWEVRE